MSNFSAKGASAASKGAAATFLKSSSWEAVFTYSG